MAYVFRGIPAGRKPKGFWHYVQKTDGCWLWTGGRHGKQGYGSFCVNGGYRKAHHIAYESFYGPLPKLGNASTDRVVMHSCDNSMCVNPAHLLIGTKSQNTKDAIARSGGKQWADKRSPRPDCRKFDRSLARSMRQSGLTWKDIAKSLGVCRASVQEALLESSHA